MKNHVYNLWQRMKLASTDYPTQLRPWHVSSSISLNFSRFDEILSCFEKLITRFLKFVSKLIDFDQFTTDRMKDLVRHIQRRTISFREFPEDILSTACLFQKRKSWLGYSLN
jgi:hypothetical protein